MRNCQQDVFDAIENVRCLARIMQRWDFVLYLVRLVRLLPFVLRERSLAPVDATFLGKHLIFRVLQRDVLLDGQCIGLAREIYGRQAYFCRPGFTPTLDDNVVDLGANVGVFTVLAARLARHVVSVEAQWGFIQELMSNVRKNGCSDRVMIEWGIMGARAGVFSNRRGLESASHYEGKEPPRLSMDDLLLRHRMEKVDLLKIDIEGSEFDLFATPASWLTRIRRLVMEVHSQWGDVNRLAESLVENGFRVQLVDRQLRVAKRFVQPIEVKYIFASREA